MEFSTLVLRELVLHGEYFADGKCLWCSVVLSLCVLALVFFISDHAFPCTIIPKQWPLWMNV